MPLANDGYLNLMRQNRLYDPIRAIHYRCGELGLSLGCAESITLGKLTSALGSVPGASKILKGGIVAYQDSAKVRILRIDPALLQTFSAVSPEVCEEMARNLLEVLDCDIALSTTGYAGPPQGDEEVGLVYLGLASRNEIVPFRIEELHLTGGREDIQDKTVVRAVEILWEEISRL